MGVFMALRIRFLADFCFACVAGNCAGIAKMAGTLGYQRQRQREKRRNSSVVAEEFVVIGRNIFLVMGMQKDHEIGHLSHCHRLVVFRHR